MSSHVTATSQLLGLSLFVSVSTPFLRASSWAPSIVTILSWRSTCFCLSRSRSLVLSFSKFHGWRRKKKPRCVWFFETAGFNWSISSGPKILKSCLLHWSSVQGPIYVRRKKMKYKNYSQTNHQGSVESLTKCYKLATLISKPSFSFSFTFYGFLTHNPETGNFLTYNLSTKDIPRIRQTQHPTEACASMIPSLNSLKVSLLPDWRHTLNSSTRSQIVNWEQTPTRKPTIPYTAHLSSYKT